MREGVKNQMQGLIIFATFFAIFLASTVAIPSPLFPGNIICLLFDISNVSQASITSALANGIFYGFIAWIIFSLGSRWIEKNATKKQVDLEKK